MTTAEVIEAFRFVNYQ